MPEYLNIKINKDRHSETIAKLQEGKPDDVSWGYYLEELRKKAGAWDERKYELMGNGDE